MAPKARESVRSQRIVILSKEGLSHRQIMAKLKVSKGTVHETRKRFAETGSVASKARSGRPKVTTPSEDQYIKLKRKTLIRKSTVKRKLYCSGLRGRKAVSKPLLRKSCLLLNPIHLDGNQSMLVKCCHE
uniref:Paired domain-containing protein n=1 Tax=Seriola lalandi dorsalis TaxID=1841481 RepID=A0A3B4WJ34_SERLL